MTRTGISRRRIIQGAAALGVSAPMLTLPAAGLSVTGAQGGDRPVLRFGSSEGDFQTLDPHLAAGTQDRTIADMVFSGLVRYVPGTVSELEPDIATEMPSAAENDDGTQTWTITLREDAMVHPSDAAGTDSYPLTAEDVVFSLKKAANPDTSSYAINYEGWSFAAVDDRTVEITLDQPLSETLFLPNIANYSGGFIIPKQPYEALGADGFMSNPVGTGPFAFESHTPQQSVVLTAFDDFYRGAPKLGGVEVRFVSDHTARELGLKSGDLDVIRGLVDAQWVDRINEEEGLIADVFGVGEVLWLNINIEIEPFDDPRVREAVLLSISQEQHVAVFGFPVGEPVYSVVPAQLMPGGLTEEEAAEAGISYEQDLERAKELLEEAGYPDGFEIDLVTSERDTYRINYEVLAEELRQIGITANLEVVQHAAMHELIREGSNAITIYGGYRPDAGVYLTQFFTADGGATNFSNFDVSDLVEQARMTTDSDEQAELWKQANIELEKNFVGHGLLLINQVYARTDAVDFGHELGAIINVYPGIDETTTINP